MYYLKCKTFEADQQERIDLGMQAFDRACLAGWPKVELTLSGYGIMPSAFTANPAGYFQAMARQALQHMPLPALASQLP